MSLGQSGPWTTVPWTNVSTPFVMADQRLGHIFPVVSLVQFMINNSKSIHSKNSTKV